MSGECDFCGEHTLECSCNDTNLGAPTNCSIMMTECPYSVDEALKILLSMPAMKRLMRSVAEK